MEFFRIKKDIPFMRHSLAFNAISFATFRLAVFFIATRGLHLSVEFTGGTLVEVVYTEAQPLEPIRAALAAGRRSRPKAIPTSWYSISAARATC